MVEAMGWAVCQDDALLVETVSPTKRAAMVNWLVVHGRIMVSGDRTDEWIAETFGWLSAARSVSLVEVRISAVDAK